MKIGINIRVDEGMKVATVKSINKIFQQSSFVPGLIPKNLDVKSQANKRKAAGKANLSWF